LTVRRFIVNNSASFKAWVSGVTYRYRLEGVDEEWRTTQEGRVEYPGLRRGDYLFEVEAIDRDLNRSQQPATVKVHVHFAYGRIAASVGIGMAVLLIALQAGRLVQRDRRLRAANETLQQQTSDLEQSNRDLQNTQSQLIQAEKMATIGLLAGGVAHEINNPLQILLDGARRILRFPADFERHQQSAGLMEQAAQRCSTVVQNLLNYTRKSGDEAEQVDLDEVLRSTVSLLQHNLQQANIHLQVKEGGPPALTGNFNELCTVVTNLVINARDAVLLNPREGVQATIEIATSATSDGAELVVSDNGPGIPEVVRERIFDPFYTTKEVGAGTGLGLSIVQGIVERHGGEIGLASSADGTTFIVRLPISPPG